MKKILIPIILIIAITSACLPASNPPSDTAPAVDMQATIDSIVYTAAAETLAAQPSPTTAPPTETATPTETVPSTEITVTLDVTAEPNLTTTPVTATSGADNNSTDGVTATPTANSAGEITLTPTLGVLTYGTLPPAVPYSQVTLANKSKAQAYISLQLCDTEAKGAILEYPVEGVFNIDAPVGTYIYVVWVGGKKITGDLKIHSNDELKITIYKDKVVVQ